MRIGLRHNKLVVVEETPRPSKSRALTPWGKWWKCQCDCGNIIVIHHSHVGKTGSCGCARRRHGMSFHPLYQVWVRMMARCSNPKVDSYRYYGGRGIKVDPAWQDAATFLRWAQKKWKPGLSLDRKNSNGNYSARNCRWATSEGQGNNKRNNVIVIYQGKKMGLHKAARLSGLPVGTVKGRHARGWPRARWFLPSGSSQFGTI